MSESNHSGEVKTPTHTRIGPTFEILQEFLGDGFKIRLGTFRSVPGPGGQPIVMSSFFVFSERGTFLGEFEVQLKKGLSREDIMVAAKELLGKNWDPSIRF